MSDEWDALLAPEQAGQFLIVDANTDRVAVVERVDEDRLPAYLSPARTRCLWCHCWCWLGDNTLKLVASGGASPMCVNCAVELLPADSQPVTHLYDTKRD